MLDQRRRRWSNITPTLAQSLVFAGIVTQSDSTTIIVVLNIKGVIHCVRQAGHIYTQKAPRWLQI